MGVRPSRTTEARPPAISLAPGSNAGRYLIVDRLRTGATSAVYTAHDPDLGRRVALELLHADASGSAREELIRRAQAVASLSHPGIVAIYDVGTVGDSVFLATELVDGETLREWMRQPRSWREAVEVMRQAGEGLAAAHGAGLVHGDLGPDQVLIARDGRVCITDFASATSTTRSPQQEGAGDARADVHSFFATFDEVLRGRPGGRAPRVPSWLRRLVAQGLQPDLDGRPATMREALDALATGSARTPRATVTVVGAAVLLLSAAVVAIAPWRTTASAAATVAPPKPTSVVDVPPPSSSNPEALAAYARGLQGMRDGTWHADEFEKAARLDPSLAAADLRYAMIEFWQFPTEGREHLARAVAERGRLSGRDQAILRAAQGWMQAQPSDDAAFVRLIDEAQARYPMDAEIAYYAGFARTQLSDHVASVARLDRAIALDPGFAAAYQLKGDEQSYAGDLEGALATLAACVDEAHDATRCLMERGFLEEAGGQCDQLEADGHRMREHDPATDMSYRMLAKAAYAQGQPLATVTDLLRERERHVRPTFVHRYELKDRYELAALRGDFEDALRAAEELGAAAVAVPDRRLRAEPALLAIDALVESGRPTEAGDVARDFLKLEQAWAPDPRSDDFAILRDSTPSFWIAERQAGLLSGRDFEHARDAWIRSWTARMPPAHRPFAWLHGYARVAETTDDAEHALAEQPGFGPIPLFTPLTFGDAFVGKTYALAGRLAEALPYLRRATRSCLALDHPFEHTEAHLLLGQALTDAGAIDEACAAYDVVLSRWGKAKPRSVTAERARALASALGCH